MTKLKEFAKKEIVLIISFILCIGSMFLVKPNQEYINYIDFKTLSLLFSLLAVMAGLNHLGVFRTVAQALINRANKVRELYIILILLCFLSSMIITNDVALITFVPFTIVALKLAHKEGHLIYIVVMETIAANLGSMLTPIGNPQNLFLFSSFDMKIIDFVRIIFPYSLLSLVLLLLGSLFVKADKLRSRKSAEPLTGHKGLIVLYIILFALSLLSLFRVLPYQILLILVIAALLIFDRKVFAKIDYSLLFTFLFLFVFIGNVGKISAISTLLQNIVVGNEVFIGVLSSQIFSNVPACILLSKFTNNINALLIGVNLGGLGTLIASMASLISYKFVQKENIKSSKYLFIFTVANIIFLGANILLYEVLTG